jgi:energy-coupling factor transporter ATP-binding protein EcfA2
MLPRSNPFSTRFTRPGALEPLDADGEPVRIDDVLHRLRARGRAAIVGPHGSGKSTLLARLADAIDSAGGTVVRLRLPDRRDRGHVLATLLTDRGKSPPNVFPRLKTCGFSRLLIDSLLAARSGDIVAIDGWETAGPLIGLIVRAVVRLRGCGLVVTAHGPVGLPVLVRCRPSVAILAAIVARLPGHEDWYGRLIHPTDVAEAFVAHRGDLRESLFALYDRYEHRLRDGGGNGGDDREARADDANAESEIQGSAAGFSCPGAPGHNLR